MIEERLCFAAVFVAEALITWLYCEYLLSRKRQRLHLICTFAAGYIALFACSFLSNTTLNAVSFCAVNFILIRYNYRCNVKMALLHTAFLYFIMVGAELIIDLIIGLFGYSFAAYTYDFHIMLVFAVLSKLLYLLFSIIGSRIFAPQKGADREPRLMLMFCVLPLLSSFVAVTTVYFGLKDGMTGNSGLMTIITVVTLLIANLIFLFLFNYLQSANEEKLQLQLSLQKEQADAAYYDALQKQLENQRILMHDIKNHLGTIDALAKQSASSEIENYISGLETTFKPFKQAKLCSDPILNLLLIRFRDECSRRGVQFHCDVRESAAAFSDAPSITALYGNLLSNALEAAEASAAKQIELSVTKNEAQSVVVSVVNSCDAAPISDGCGGYFTKKSGRIPHGIGLRSISRVVAKYHGVAAMYYDAENKQFHHVIQFPEFD